jgi:hypothetical protein
MKWEYFFQQTAQKLGTQRKPKSKEEGSDYFVVALYASFSSLFSIECPEIRFLAYTLTCPKLSITGNVSSTWHLVKQYSYLSWS